MPVATTSPRPRPRVANVPLKARLVRSPRASSGWSRASACLVTGWASPVSVDSSHSSSAHSSRRRSAGTRSPACSNTKSPGTSSAAGRLSTWPPRRTRAWGAARRLSAATARSARSSCSVPIAALRMTITRMAILSTGSPISPEIRAAASSTRIMKSLNWPSSIASGERRRPSTIWFGPCSSSRVRARSGRRPVSASLSSRATAASVFSRCQGVPASTSAPHQPHQYDRDQGDQHRL